MFSKLLGFETFPIVAMVSVPVSKNFGIEKVLVSKNFGFEKKYRYRFRKNLVSKKFGIEKSIGIGFVKFCIGKSIGIGIRKKLVSKKVSDSVSKIFGIGNFFSVLFRFWVSSQTATTFLFFSS